MCGDRVYLRESEEEDDVDDGEGEHVARDHGEDHRHKGSRQLHCPAQTKSKVSIQYETKGAK